jgi:hypothetical protein
MLQIESSLVIDGGLMEVSDLGDQKGGKVKNDTRAGVFKGRPRSSGHCLFWSRNGRAVERQELSLLANAYIIGGEEGGTVPAADKRRGEYQACGRKIRCGGESAYLVEKAVFKLKHQTKN